MIREPARSAQAQNTNQYQVWTDPTGMGGDRRDGQKVQGAIVVAGYLTPICWVDDAGLTGFGLAVWDPSLDDDAGGWCQVLCPGTPPAATNWGFLEFQGTPNAMCATPILFAGYFPSNDDEETEPWAASSSVPPVTYAEGIVFSFQAGLLGTLSTTKTTSVALQVLATVFNTDQTDVLTVNASVTVAAGDAGGEIDWAAATIDICEGSDLTYTTLDGAGLVSTGAGGTYSVMVQVNVSPIEDD